MAKLSGLSRVTISQLENGTLNDLGLNKLKAVMDILGISIETAQPAGLKSALPVAARSISTSYRLVVAPDQLAWMLRTGQVPEKYQSHLMALLGEVAIPIVIQAVKEAATTDIPAKKIMRNIRQWSKQWNLHRASW